MSYQDCIAEIKQAGGELITQGDAEELLTRIDNRRRQLLAAGMIVEPDVLRKEIADEVKLEAKIKGRSSAINLRRRLELEDFVLSGFEEKPADGLQAVLTGISASQRGARLSIDAQKKAIAGKYVGGLITELENDGLMHEFKLGHIDQDVVRELWEVDRLDGKPGYTQNVNAKKIAEIIHRYQELARREQNSAGAFIAKEAGYIVRQSHDMFKLRKVSFEEWRDFILPRLDTERTFQGADDVDHFLRKAYNGLATGEHLKAEGAGPSGTASLAHKVSAARVLHFKDADSWFEYNAKFGSGNLRESLMNGLERAGENVAIMKTLGTNPEDTYRRVMDSIKRKYEGDVKKLDSLNGRGLENRFKEVMGETRIPANHMAAKVGSIVRAVQSMSKLGGAVISAFSDVPLYAGEMRYQGRGYLSSTAEAMTGLLRGRGSQEQKEIVSVWGVTMDAVRSDLATRFSAHDDMPGAMTRAMRKFFKLNGLEWWTDTMRTSATLGMAHHIALQKSKGWDSIDDSLRHTLSLYGIDSGKWDMIRKTANKQADGRDYATPEGLRNISAADLRSYLGNPNASESEISRLRDEVENQFRTYMQDRVEYAVINPDANTRAAMLQGTQPGTVLGEGLRFVMQFKAFPVAVLQKTWGRDLFSKGQADIPALATMIAMSGLTGYVAMSAKDILKGKEPRDPLDPKTIVAAMLQGGGAGIYGDFLFGRYTRFGNSTIASLAGPTAGSFEDAVNMVQAVREGDLKGAGNEAYRFTTSHLPGANLFYTKPVMDYLITYQIQEFMNPGYLRRMEKRIAKDTGQDFWELPFASGRPSDHVPRGGLWGF